MLQKSSFKINLNLDVNIWGNKRRLRCNKSTVLIQICYIRQIVEKNGSKMVHYSIYFSNYKKAYHAVSDKYCILFQ
jgi:hypothetical protein